MNNATPSAATNENTDRIGPTSWWQDEEAALWITVGTMAIVAVLHLLLFHMLATYTGGSPVNSDARTVDVRSVLAIYTPLITAVAMPVWRFVSRKFFEHTRTKRTLPRRSAIFLFLGPLILLAASATVTIATISQLFFLEYDELIANLSYICSLFTLLYIPLFYRVLGTGSGGAGADENGPPPPR